MNDANTIPNVTDALKHTDDMRNSVLDWGVGSLLNAQSDLLVSAETTLHDWLRRRHEAIADTQQLFASMHAGHEPVDTLKAQQEWVSRSFRRLAADADAYHSVARHLLDRAPSWFPREGGLGFPAGNGNAGASQAQSPVTHGSQPSWTE